MCISRDIHGLGGGTDCGVCISRDIHGLGGALTAVCVYPVIFTGWGGH